jgi:hypothetical protein
MNREQVITWAREDASVLRTLHSLLWDPKHEVCWQAIEAIGIVSSELIRNDDETIREFVRRLFWAMNDESGNTCWYATETIGEIMNACPKIRDEFFHVYMSFTEEEPFEAGVRWGLHRMMENNALSEEQIALARAHESKLVGSLSYAKPQIRGTAVMALRALSINIPEKQRLVLAKDKATFDLYDFGTHRLTHPTVASALAMK